MPASLHAGMWPCFHAGLRSRQANLRRPATGKRGLNRSIAAQGWAEFLEILAGKAERAGVRVVEVPPASRSQGCPGCGTKIPKRMSKRMHCRGACSLELGRDVNAARNVLERALRAGGWGIDLLHPRHVEPGMEDLTCKAVPRCRTVYGCSSPGGCQLKYIIPLISSPLYAYMGSAVGPRLALVIGDPALGVLLGASEGSVGGHCGQAVPERGVEDVLGIALPVLGEGLDGGPVAGLECDGRVVIAGSVDGMEEEGSAALVHGWRGSG